MPGKIIENNVVTQLWAPASRTATVTIFNSDSSTGSGLFVRDYDEVVFQVDVGAVGATTTLDLAIYESNDNNSDNATAVTGAAFTQIVAANANSARLLSVRTAGRKNYLWARCAKAAHTNAILWSINAILGKPDARPVTQTVDADVE